MSTRAIVTQHPDRPGGPTRGNEVRIPKSIEHIAYYDIENAPTSFRERYPLTKPIAIAWNIDGQTDYWAKNASDESLAEGLERFRRDCWTPATLIVGHNIRQHDNPIVNAAILRATAGKGAPLSEKLCRDTLRDLIALKGIGRSLEALCVYFGLGDRKMHLSEAEWEELWEMDTPEKRAVAIDRCQSDVAITIQVSDRLHDNEWLHDAKIWRP